MSIMIRIAPAYRGPFIFSLALQTPIVLLFSIMLDGGYLRMFALGALAGYWLGCFLIVIRRHASATRMDLVFVRWGFLMLLVVAFILPSILSVGR
jgi:hypothetical protein